MGNLAADFARDGFVVFDADPRVLDWVQAALPIAVAASRDEAEQATWLRHCGTRFVGVDALPNAGDGSIGGVALRGPWERLVTSPDVWHRAQASVTYPGYPQKDEQESESAHRFRVMRDGAHVDGLHLEAGRRVLREPHAFILGLPLNDSDACPLVVWRASHKMMRGALARAIGSDDPIGADVTEAYKAARSKVFEANERVEVQMRPGQAVLLDRFLVHGVTPWRDGMLCPDEGRIVAYFRPEFTNAADWLLG